MINMRWAVLPVVLSACNAPPAGNAPAADNGVGMTSEGSSTEGTAAASNQGDSSMMAAPPSATDAGSNAGSYVEKAGAGDLFEIESSKAILAKTKNADIKSFAQQMLDAHTQSTAKIKAAAQQANVAVPQPKLDAAQQHMMNEMNSANGQAADDLYLAAQRSAHDQALALHQGFAEKGEAPSLRKAAGEIAGVVKHHISMLEKFEER